MKDIFRAKSYLLKMISHPLFAGSFTMILGSNFVNFLNYIYHLFMGRLLGPSEYGELASLLSLIGLIGMIPFSLGLVIVKFTSSAKDKNEIKSLIFWLGKWTLYLGFSLFILILVLSPLISKFLKIDNTILITLVGSIFLFSLPSFVGRSILQGVLRFKQMVLSLLAENFIKLVLGVLLVYLGYSVFGAIVALVVAAFLGFASTKYFTSDLSLTKYLRKPNIKSMFKYSLPVIGLSVAQTSLFSSDLILVKHFFTSYDAGIYASLSTLGKIIFFGAGPIGSVMFPMISRRQAEGLKFRNIFYYSLLLTCFGSLSILLAYWLLPELAINLLYGAQYIQASGLLIFFGLFISMLTISNLFITFYFSLGKTRVVVLPIIASIFQVVGVIYYHQSLFSVIVISNIVAALLLLSLTVYSVYERKVNFRYSSGLQTRRNDSERSEEDKRDLR